MGIANIIHLILERPSLHSHHRRASHAQIVHRKRASHCEAFGGSNHKRINKGISP
jgi:hypothetical protein